MKRRYEFTDIDQDRYRSSRYPEIPRSDNDLFIISRTGDRLDLLANRFYGSAEAWWILAEANQIGKGTLVVPPGMQLRIPDSTMSYRDMLEQAEEEK
jgi:phage tail protein X